MSKDEVFGKTLNSFSEGGEGGGEDRRRERERDEDKLGKNK